MTQWTIYCHTLVSDGRRYVGLTKLTMLRRWNQHIQKTKNLTKVSRSHLWNAIRKYGKDAFSHEILQVCNTVEEGNEAEKYWIAKYDTRNPEKGFNLAEGGGQYVPMGPRKNPWDDPDYRARLTASSKEVNARPEVRAAISAAATGRTHSPEARARISAFRIGKNHSPEVIARITFSNIRTFSDPSVRAGVSERSKGLWADPVYREKVTSSSMSSDPDVRARIGSILVGRKSSPEVVQKLLDHHKRKRESHPDYKTHHLCGNCGPVLFKNCYQVVRRGVARRTCKKCAKDRRVRSESSGTR